MTMTQRGSSLNKAKLARQIEELRENGEAASDAATHNSSCRDCDKICQPEKVVVAAL